MLCIATDDCRVFKSNMTEIRKAEDLIHLARSQSASSVYQTKVSLLFDTLCFLFTVACIKSVMLSGSLSCYFYVFGSKFSQRKTRKAEGNAQ